MAKASARHIVNRAFGSSSANDPGHTATETELLNVLRARLRVLYNRATKLNPYFSAVFKDVSPSDNRWERPEGALRVIRLEAAPTNTGNSAVVDPGTEVHNVPVDDRTDAELPPRVYRLGLCYHTVGATGDPSSGADGDVIRFIYSDDSPGIAGLEACLPDLFPDETEDLLVFYLAKYLALKDKARGDTAAFDDVEETLLDEFDASVLDADMNVTKRFGRSAGGGLTPPERQGS